MGETSMYAQFLQVAPRFVASADCLPVARFRIWTKSRQPEADETQAIRSPSCAKAPICPRTETSVWGVFAPLPESTSKAKAMTDAAVDWVRRISARGLRSSSALEELDQALVVGLRAGDAVARPRDDRALGPEPLLEHIADRIEGGVVSAGDHELGDGVAASSPSGISASW